MRFPFLSLMILGCCCGLQLKAQFSEPRLLYASDIHDPTHGIPCDLDGDGLMDALVTSASDNQVYWFRRQIDGSYDKKILPFSLAETVPIYVRATDLDQDRDLDVIVLYEDRMGYFENQGNGYFNDEIHLITEKRYFSEFQIADLDVDGDPDIVIIGVDDAILFFNEGGGNLRREAVRIPNGSPENSTALIGNFDADPSLEILLGISYGGSYGGGYVQGSILKYNAERKTYEKVETDSYSLPFRYLRIPNQGKRPIILQYDWDDDGLPDLFSLNGASLVWSKNKGSLQFSPFEKFATLTTEQEYVNSVKLQIADLDGVGKPELITMSSLATPIINRYPFQEGTLTSIGNLVLGDSYYDYILQDMDGDSDLDLFLVSSSYREAPYKNSSKSINSVFWLDYDEQQFITRNDIAYGLTKPKVLLFTDVNADQRLDIIINNTNDKTLGPQSSHKNNFGLLLNNGNDPWPTDRFVIPHFDRRILGLVDIDQDQKQDLILVNSYEYDIIRYLKGTDQGFAAKEITIGNRDEGFIEMEDLDQDGDPDFYGVVRTKENTSILVWQKNTGETFEREDLFQIEHHVQSPIVCQMDENEGFEIFYKKGWRGELYATWNQDPSSTKVFYQPEDGVSYIATNPLQLIRAPDGSSLLFAQYYKRSPQGGGKEYYQKLFRYKGDQTLEEIDLGKLPNGYRYHIIMDDFDQDGDLDFATIAGLDKQGAYSFNYFLHVAFNEGNFQFAEPLLIPLGRNNQLYVTFDAMDYDRDGDLDFILCDSKNEQVWLIENYLRSPAAKPIEHTQWTAYIPTERVNLVLDIQENNQFRAWVAEDEQEVIEGEYILDEGRYVLKIPEFDLEVVYSSPEVLRLRAPDGYLYHLHPIDASLDMVLNQPFLPDMANTKWDIGEATLEYLENNQFSLISDNTTYTGSYEFRHTKQDNDSGWIIWELILRWENEVPGDISNTPDGKSTVIKVMDLYGSHMITLDSGHELHRSKRLH